MKIVVFGLSISSAWGNGHATLWRALCGALARRGHRIVFFERDAPYYASHRDLCEIAGGSLILYADWREVRGEARCELGDADLGIVTSFCPDGVSATDLLLDAPSPLRAFYDLDTPVTLARWRSGEGVPYLTARGLRDFDLALSYTGGAAVDALRDELGAPNAVPLYGSVDPGIHRAVAPSPAFAATLSYLGTYAQDRHAAFERLFLDPARSLAGKPFLAAGALYPEDPWPDNVRLLHHVAPSDHAAFYSSSRATLNITRGVMAAMGFCPSGRLFEAAACGAPIISDWWEGLDSFFTPGSEIHVAHSAGDVVDALSGAIDLEGLGKSARERVLDEHTADHRAAELETILESLPLPELEVTQR